MMQACGQLTAAVLFFASVSWRFLELLRMHKLRSKLSWRNSWRRHCWMLSVFRIWTLVRAGSEVAVAPHRTDQLKHILTR